MLAVPFKGWANILAHIDQDDVYDPDGDHGYSLYPHITVLYGLHQVEKPINMMLYIDKMCEPMDVEFTSVDCFQNDKFDVVKFNVNCPGLNQCHDVIKKRFACTEQFSYEPHMTIAYIKKGLAWKYSNVSFSIPNMKIDFMRFTNADGHETLIKLRKNEQVRRER